MKMLTKKQNMRKHCDEQWYCDDANDREKSAVSSNGMFNCSYKTQNGFIQFDRIAKLTLQTNYKPLRAFKLNKT